MRTVKTVLLLVAATFLLCGCGDYKEPDSRYVVAAFGISENDGYTLYIETLSVGTDITSANPRLFKASGKTLDLAFKSLKRNLPKEPSLSHCGAVVVSETGDTVKLLNFALKSGVNPSAVAVKSPDVEKLLSLEAEKSAVGFDVFAIVKENIKGNYGLYFSVNKKALPVLVAANGGVEVKK